MLNQTNNQLYDRIHELGIAVLLTNKKTGFGITDLDELKYYADYFEKLNHIDNNYFWALDALKIKIKKDRYDQSFRSLRQNGQTI